MLKRYKYVDGLTAVPGFDRVLISLKGSVKDKWGDDLPWDLDSDGYRIIPSLGRKRVIDLQAIVFKCFDLPFSLHEEVLAFPINGDKENRDIENIGYRFKSGKLEIPKHSGFYYIPGFLKYGINNSGDLICTEDGEPRIWTVTKPNLKNNSLGGYRMANVRFDRKRVIPILRHRAMLLAFTDYPNDVDALVSNHIDGIPGNDWLSNLELVTRRYNNIHAYENDLKNQNKRVLIRNVLTGVINEYRSISIACKALGLASDEALRFRIYNAEFSKVFSDGTQVKLKTDERDWIIPSDPESEIRKNTQAKSIVIRNCRTLEVFRFSTITDACRFMGVEGPAMSFHLQRGRSKPWRGWQFHKEEDFIEFADFSKTDLEESSINYLIPIEIDGRNLNTNESKTFKSLREVEQVFKGYSLRLQLMAGKQPITPNGWQFKYKKDDWSPISSDREISYTGDDQIMSKCEQTGIITISENAVKLGAKLGIPSQKLRESAMTGGNEVYRGHRFRFGISVTPWPTSKIYVRE